MQQAWKVPFIWFLLTVTCAMMIVATVYLGVQPEEQQYASGYQPTTFTSVALSTGGSGCCELRNCQCRQATAGSSICSGNSTLSTCGNGYACCATAYETCVSCQTVNKKQQCTNYQCHEHCVSSVTEQACEWYCSTCYTPSVTFQYSTVADQTEQASLSQACGIDGTVCAQSFLQLYALNTTVGGFYNVKNYQDIQMHSKPAWHLTGGYIAGFVLLAVCTSTGFVIWLYHMRFCVRYYVDKHRTAAQVDDILRQIPPPYNMEIDMTGVYAEDATDATDKEHVEEVTGSVAPPPYQYSAEEY